MNFVGLILRTLRHDWRSSLGIAAGVAVTATVLVGALAVGDSVRATLAARAQARIGHVELALNSGERFVGDGLAARIADGLEGDGAGPVQAASVLRLPGFASGGGSARISSTAIVDVLGVDGGFLGLAPGAPSLPDEVLKGPQPERTWISEVFARRLELEVGDDVLLRIEKSTPLPRDSALSTIDDISFAVRAKVGRVLSDAEFGGFSLNAGQTRPSVALLDRTWLQEEMELGGLANLLLFGRAPSAAGPVSGDESVDSADAAQQVLRRVWTAADAQLELVPTGQEGRSALRSKRIFVEDPVVDAVRDVLDASAGAAGDPTVVFTWFCNGLTAGETTVPYSTVSAVGPLLGDAGAPEESGDALAALVAGLGDDRIAVTQWLADDLGVTAGGGDGNDASTLKLDYYVMGARQQLTEDSASYTVGRVLPMAGAAIDRTLMPPFPGLSGADSCQDWEPGIPVQLDRIREVDERYWDDYGGAPKAYVTLAAGRRMWGGPQGATTGIRMNTEVAQRVLDALPSALDPRRLGLVLLDVRTDALATGSAATDFGGLFLGLSMFLIAAALILTSLLFAFAVEKRAPQIGVLLASGFRPGQVRILLLGEAAVLAVVGGVVGAGLGLGFTRVVLWGLESGWRGALGGTASVEFAPSGMSIAIGAFAAAATALLSILGATRAPFRASVVSLLKSRGGVPRESDSVAGPRRLRIVPALTIGGLVFAVVLVLVAPSGASQAAAGAFFGAGALLLVALVSGARWLLGAFDGGTFAKPGGASVASLGLRNAARRPGRSVATVALLGSGMFLVVAVQSFQLAPPADPGQRDTGTGGFSLWARTVLPVLRDPDTQEGRDAYGLLGDTYVGTDFVPMQVVEGDDASCLNLGSPQNPRLLGVETEEFVARDAFVFGSVQPPEGVTLAGDESPWSLLDADYGDNIVPAVGDAASILWTMHKSVGDSLTYLDDRGQEFEIRLVGATVDSLLQGSLVISDRHLEERFGSVVGFREFFIDVPQGKVDAVQQNLRRMMADVGMELMGTQERLRAFQAVQNTYLVIFQALGFLGLLLGSIGLGLVVLRNVLERRSELATMFAVGFSPSRIRWLVWSEHGLLLVLGLVGGAASAALAVAPGAGSGGGGGFAWEQMAWMVGLIALSGVVWVSLATFAATRGATVQALREE